MQAIQSMLRLLALFSCADVAMSFGTFRTGSSDEVMVGTESAGSSAAFTSCPCNSYWYCTYSGTESLLSPKVSVFDNNALADYVNHCWNICYKDPGYMVDGSQAPFFDMCGSTDPNVNTAASTYRAGICSTFIDDLTEDTTKSNPYKDSQDAPNDVYKLDACQVPGGQSVDPLAPVAQRCSGVLQEPDGGTQFFSGNCETASQALVDSGDAASVEEVCTKLYKYWSDSTGANRMVGYCEMDRTADPPTCGWGETGIVANECQFMLCTGTDEVPAAHPTNPTCLAGR